VFVLLYGCFEVGDLENHMSLWPRGRYVYRLLVRRQDKIKWFVQPDIDGLDCVSVVVRAIVFAGLCQHTDAMVVEVRDEDSSFLIDIYTLWEIERCFCTGTILHPFAGNPLFGDGIDLG